MLGGSAADALIGVDVYQRPLGVPDNKILVVSLLKLVRGCLPGIISGYARIDAYALAHIIVVIIRIFSFGEESVIVLVNLHSDALPNTFFLFGIGVPAITQAAPSVLLGHPAASASQEKGRISFPACLPDNTKPA